MRCVILQPSYIPWRGYFDLIRRADVFVFYDDVQYDKRGWRNRNRVKTPLGSRWLTIPVRSKGNTSQALSIKDIPMSHPEWSIEHRQTLTRLYGSAPHFDASFLEELYADPPELLADFTIRSTQTIARRLGIEQTRFLRSSELAGIEGRRTDRLIAILQRLGATHYLSGPSAKDYVEAEKFEEAGIVLEWMTYDYPDYPQLHPPFDPFVTVLDLLFMTGPDAPGFIWRRS
ncbi:MAG: uncharacterized protein JWN02_1308 [Acidobacteria bacterium]|nr:uncharacterized protein [Acidobacteriota bacterium]